MLFCCSQHSLPFPLTYSGITLNGEHDGSVVNQAESFFKVGERRNELRTAGRKLVLWRI